MDKLDLGSNKPKKPEYRYRNPDKSILTIGFNWEYGGLLASVSKARATDDGKHTVEELKIQKTVNTDADAEAVSW